MGTGWKIFAGILTTVAVVGGTVIVVRRFMPRLLHAGVHRVNPGQKIRLEAVHRFDDAMLLSFYDLEGDEVDNVMGAISIMPTELGTTADVVITKAGIARIMLFAQNGGAMTTELFVLDSTGRASSPAWLLDPSPSRAEQHDIVDAA